MAANRRNQTAAARFGPAVKAFLLCLFIGGSGVGYVWQKNQIYALGQQIRQAETRLEELRRLNKQRSDTLAHLRSPQYLDARVKELKLGLTMPHPDQIWRLADVLPMVKPAEKAASPPAGRLAAR
jgi:hypothetical protein